MQLALGIKADGTAAPNGNGVAFAGNKTSANRIGGVAVGDRNVISGNSGDGIVITNGASNNTISGNNIGTNPDGTNGNVGNKGAGVNFGEGTQGNQVKSNRIKFNNGAGVRNIGNNNDVFDANSIYQNGALGIDDGAPGEQPTGHPVLTSAVESGGQTIVTGTFQGQPNTLYILEFFTNEQGDPSGFGEGETFIGSEEVQTDGSGQSSFTATVGASPVGYVISATATDPAPGGGTSEFSNWIPLETTVTFNSANTNTTAVISFNDGQGDSATDEDVYASQLNVTLTPATGPSQTINTFCIDLTHAVSFGQTYSVFTRDDLDTAFANGSRMAYIFDNFGQGDLSSDPDQAEAVQIALWDLSLNNHDPTSFQQDGSVYDSGDPAVFSVNLSGNPDAANIASLVNTYLQASVGATTSGAWLDASAAGSAPNRGQSLMLLAA